MATNKAVVTFGVRGGACSGQHVLPIRAAAKVARDMAHVFGMGGTGPGDFIVSRRVTAQSLVTSTHYVSVQLLTGDGDKSAALWRKS